MNVWAPWNDQIVSLVGGTVINQCDGSETATVYAHALTAGVSTVRHVCGSLAVGGTALFTRNFATLWGVQESVLTILDSDMQSDLFIPAFDNRVFSNNTAQWLAAGPVVATPEPASFVLFGSGLAALGIFVRRRRV